MLAQGQEWDKNATARMTGIPASIGAQLLVHGQAASKGVVDLEICFNPTTFFAELAKWGIFVNASLEENFSF